MTQRNVLGKPLAPCCLDPMTGFHRDGYCSSLTNDQAEHTLCAYVTQDFLDYSTLTGNDLTTPRPELAFPGLTVGDKWCICVSRFLQALEVGLAPPIDIEATHESVLQYMEIEIINRYAVDLAVIDPLSVKH